MKSSNVKVTGTYYLATPRLPTNVLSVRIKSYKQQRLILYKDFTSLLDVMQQQTVDGLDRGPLTFQNQSYLNGVLIFLSCDLS